jgi:hypothetical protein
MHFGFFVEHDERSSVEVHPAVIEDERRECRRGLGRRGDRGKMRDAPQ